MPLLTKYMWVLFIYRGTESFSKYILGEYKHKVSPNNRSAYNIQGFSVLIKLLVKKKKSLYELKKKKQNKKKKNNFREALGDNIRCWNYNSGRTSTETTIRALIKAGILIKSGVYGLNTTLSWLIMQH